MTSQTHELNLLKINTEKKCFRKNLCIDTVTMVTYAGHMTNEISQHRA